MTCDDCLNYRTQRGRMWCREGLTPPADARECTGFDDVIGTGRPGRKPHRCADLCADVRRRWLAGEDAAEIALHASRTRRWVYDWADKHDVPQRPRGGSRASSTEA